MPNLGPPAWLPTYIGRVLSGAGLMAPHDHRVRFYEGDAELVGALAAFVTDGLASGERVILVSTEAHRSALDEALAGQAVETGAARASGALLTLDAEDTLDRFMVSGGPDPARFEAVIGEVLHAGGNGGPVRVFGEMVALLWEDGDARGAIELETLWNRLAAHEEFSLLCAYPTWMVQSGRLGDLKQVCREHSGVLPPAHYDSGRSTGEDGDADQRSAVFIPAPQSVRAARRFVRGALDDWGLHTIVSDAELVVSEMATNALVHAQSPFRLYLHRADDVIFLCLKDAGSGAVEAAVEAAAGHAHATHGRGVAIVDAVADRWGCDQLADGKVVWAEFSSRLRTSTTDAGG